MIHIIYEHAFDITPNDLVYRGRGGGCVVVGFLTPNRNDILSFYIPNFRKMWQKDKLFGVRKGARSSHANG